VTPQLYFDYLPMSSIPLRADRLNTQVHAIKKFLIHLPALTTESQQ